MKILFILNMPFNPEDGGVQRTTYKLSTYFNKLGFKICVYTLFEKGNISLDDIKIRCKSKNESLVKSLERTINSENPDVVINQVPHDISVTNALGKVHRNKHILLLACLRNSLMSVMNNPSLYLEDGFNLSRKLADNKILQKIGLTIHKLKHKWILKKILNVHDKFVLLAPSNITELDFFLKEYPKNKIVVIPNSIPSIHSTPKKKNSLLYVGRIDERQKQSQYLLEIWIRIADFLPEWHFDVVGDGPYLKEMKKRIRETKVPRIRLHGQSNPDKFYANAKIMLMTSAYEGFPNVLIEGQSFGVVPVCLDSYSAIKDIVTDGKNCILIKPHKIEDFSEKILELANNNRLIKEMSQAAVENASKYIIENVGEMWLQLFKNNDLNAS